MKISIITICFNNEKDIRLTLESVINQTYNDIEYIIVDGSSTDSTLNIIKEYEIEKVISEPDRGLYDAINKGINIATGDIVGLIHGGDLLYSETTIKKIAEHFEKNDIDALYGNSKIISEDGTTIIRINKSPIFKKKLFKRGWFPSHQSFYAKRSLFKKYGLYNLKYRIAADYELLLRFLYCNSPKVKLLDEYIVKFRLGGTSTKSIKNIIIQNRECIQAWKDNGLKMPFYTIPMKLIRKLQQFAKAKFYVS
jgi:Glycosyltransferases involved in cell wall biogenesis